MIYMLLGQTKERNLQLGRRVLCVTSAALAGCDIIQLSIVSRMWDEEKLVYR